MNRIAGLTVVRGNGGCEAYWNGIVNEEMKKLNEQHALELRAKDAELEATRGARNRLLRDNLTAYRVLNARPISAFRRLRERLVTFWCVFWALGEHFGCWEYIRDEENQ